jgi:hypothetical protein
MAVTPERKAELIAALEELIGPRPMPKPKVVIRDDDIVRDADPHVSRADPNYVESEERLRRRALDPCRLGLYGPIDDEDE